MSLKLLLLNHYIHVSNTIILGIASSQQTYTVKFVTHDYNLDVLGPSFILKIFLLYYFEGGFIMLFDLWNHAVEKCQLLLP